MIADNADDALLGVERLRPDLVLMDIRLRGPKDGIETADQIRLQVSRPGHVCGTAHADDDTLQRAGLTEPFGYIVKSFRASISASELRRPFPRVRASRTLARLKHDSVQ